MHMPHRLHIAAVMAFLAGAVIGAEAATTVTVVQRGLVLNRASLALGKGDRVVFTNEDDVIHNIHIFGPAEDEKDLGLQKPGTTLSYTFDKLGAYRVRCNIHPSIKMAVTVR
jgi:plastocyanin